MKLAHYASSFLRKEELSQPRVVTVAKVEVETVGQGQGAEEKPVVYFAEIDGRGVPLNRTNLRTLFELFGTDDSDSWKGRKVEIFNDLSVRFNGAVGGIRFREAAPEAVGHVPF